MGSGSGQAGLRVLVGHGRPASHLCLACAPVSRIGQSRVLQGKKLWLKPNSQWSKVKKSRLNASAHQIGSSLVCHTPGWGLWEVLLVPPDLQACLGFLDKSVVEIHVLPWDMLIQLKMLPAEKSLLALLGRQWIGGYREIFIRISLINLSWHNLCFPLHVGYIFPAVRAVRKHRVVPGRKKNRVAVKSCSHTNAEKDYLKNV